MAAVVVAFLGCDKGGGGDPFGDYCGRGECWDEWMGDGQCDQACNCVERDWDGGDCEQSGGVVTGSLSFQVRTPSIHPDGSVVLDQLITLPAISMLAIVVDSSGETVLGGAQVGEDGRFVVPVSSVPDGSEVLMFAALWAPSLDSPNTVFAVLRPEAGGEPQSAHSKAWSWHTSVPAGGNAGDIVVTEEQGSGAMFLFLVSAAAMETILADILKGDESRLKSLAFIWSPGIEWSCGSCFGSGYPQYLGDTSALLEQSIWISGGVGDSSCWGYPVILHEFGHYVAANYSRDDSPGGAHYVGSKVAAPFAWSEGWASFFAVSTFSRWAQDRRPVFWDIQQGSSLWHDYSAALYDNGSAIAGPDPQGGMGQDLDENFVSVMLWDLWDGKEVPEEENSPLDLVALGTPAVYSAVGSSRFLSQDRGAPGADFADFLDAVICNGLTESRDSFNYMLLTLFGFPYDDQPSCP
jgi:hypothetical protein